MSVGITGWSFTQKERNEAIATAKCPFCGARKKKPCMKVRPRTDFRDYTGYAHLDRIEEVFEYTIIEVEMK